MALINCPECSKEISDKVKACPHCGYPFEEQRSVSQTKNQPVKEVNTTPQKSKAKKLLLTGIPIVLVIVALIIGIGYINKKTDEKNAERLYKSNYNQYIANLSSVHGLMLTGAADAEGLNDLTAKVWYNAIYEERDYQTDEFTRPDGTFVDDFNDALYNLSLADSTIKVVSDIKDNQNQVKALMQKAQNPPDGLEVCYDTVTEMYSAYIALTDLAVYPSGSLKSFTENKNEKVDDFMVFYKKLELQIPTVLPLD